MVLGRIITFLHAQHLSVVPVQYMTKVFVSGDLLSFILQAAGKIPVTDVEVRIIFNNFLGGGIMSHGSIENMKIGQYVIIGGLCVQLLFFGAFLLASLLFHYRISESPTSESEDAKKSQGKIIPRDWRGLLLSSYYTSVLILIRSVYRLVEFAQGNDGYIISHETFLYVFDAAMMFCVMLLMNLFHPSLMLWRNANVEHGTSERVV